MKRKRKSKTKIKRKRRSKSGEEEEEGGKGKEFIMYIFLIIRMVSYYLLSRMLEFAHCQWLATTANR